MQTDDYSGNPVWDFTYPESSFFIAEDRFMGCSICSTRPGYVVYVACGSTYPLVLRPDGEEFRIRGFAYVHGIDACREEGFGSTGFEDPLTVMHQGIPEHGDFLFRLSFSVSY